MQIDEVVPMPRRMASKERLLTAINHREPDFVLVSLRIHVWLKDNYGCSCWLHELRAAEKYVGPFTRLRAR